MKILDLGDPLGQAVSSSDHQSLGRITWSLIGKIKFSAVRANAGQCDTLFFSCGETE